MKKTFFDYIMSILLFVIVLAVLLPILHILASSLTPPENIDELKPWAILPEGFTLDYYRIILSDPQLIGSYINSIVITFVHVCLALTCTTLAAYALSNKFLPFRRVFMSILIFIMVFEPGIMQEYMVVKELGLMDTRVVLMVLNCVSAFYLIVLIRFFEDVPAEIVESSVIDGASDWQIFRKIMVPLAKPAIITIGLFYGILKWNEYFKASIYVTSPDKYTLQQVLNRYVVENDIQGLVNSQTYMSKEELMLMDMGSLQDATIILAMLPALVVFPIVLKFHVKGQFSGSEK